MTTDLKAAVLAYLVEHTKPDVPAPPYDAPVFRHVDNPSRDWSGPVWKSGRPAVTAVSLELLDAASVYVAPGGLGWDGECLTMPGDLRYRPVGLDEHGRSVVCVKVGP